MSTTVVLLINHHLYALKLLRLYRQDITLGDIIKLVAGSRIPADIRIIEQSGLKLDKSMLTGESEAVKMISSNVPADVPMLEALNMAFMGSNIVEGGGLGIVIAIGANTQLAKIFQKVSDFDIETTSLQKEIDRFVRIIATFALVTIIAVILHWTFYLRVEHEGFMTPSSMLANAISVFVAFVPQGLPLALSMGLTIICRRLCATHKVLVKQMSTIETVGSMNMLASDKTGTLTQNLMTVSDIILFEQTVDVATFAAIDEKVKIAVMEVAVMCNQAHYDEEENERNTSDGSSEVDGVPTINNSISGGNEVDRALLKFSIAGSMWKSVVTSQRHRVIMPFNSSTKIAAVVVARNGNLMSAATLSDTQSSVYVKGAPEYILERCSHFLQQHVISDMTIEASRSIQERINVLSNQGKRVIALARYNILPSEEKQMYQVDPTPNFPLTGLTFICCIAVSDPPRVGVLEAVTTIRGAGIAVAMVTGDAPTTAAAIARKVGIITATTATRFCDIIRASALSLDDIEARITTTDALVARTALQKEPSAIIVEGKDLIGITEQQWDRVFEFSEMVFARTTPENKLEIVKECQRRGRRVGVTGDGVNDSPALKVADIGIAMGSGSEVSRDAAAIVLLTDNFASIVHGIEEGRLIFANLRKVIAFQIAAGCWSELLPVLATFFVGMPTPLSSFLMIIISCMTDVYGGVALMWESPESALMLQSPRNRETQPLVTSVLVAYSYLFYGTLEAIAAFSTYFIYMANRGPTNVVADPIPSDDNGNLNFPAGYTMSQLLFAWNWGSNSGNLGRDTMLAGNVGSFVFFVVLIVCQWGHLCSVRRSMPYLSDAILNIRNEPKPLSSRIIAELSTWRPNLRVLAAISFSALTAVLFTETPAIQASCGTGSVPPVYWGIAIAFSFGIFVLAEIRKWLLVLYPRWLGWLVW